MTQSATSYLNVPVDGDKAFSELVDGYEAAAVSDNMKAQRLESAAYVIGKALETSAINALVNGGTTLQDTQALSVNDVYTKIASMVKDLKARGINTNDIRIAVDAETELLLLSDSKFANTSSTIGAELIREGVIGKINGALVKPNYLLPTNVEVIAYAKPWCQAIDAWKFKPSFEDIKDGKHVGSSALQGRMVYADKVTNALAVEIKTKGTVSL